MPKPRKSRTPPPPPPPRRSPGPRPVRAKRSGGTSPPGERKRLLLWLLGGGVAVAAIVVAVALGARGGGGGDPEEELAAAGCTLKSTPAQEARHVTSLPKGFSYNSFPPTSGSHYPQPAIWNIYDRPVQQIYLVHNLEHGGMIVQYGDEVAPGTVDQIREWYISDPNGIVVAPLPSLRNRIALTAWTHLATCKSFDENGFDAFSDAYRGQGPESIPLDRLTPAS